MSKHFQSLVFTDAVKALQERYGSRKQYGQTEASGASSDRLGPGETSFIADRDTFYIASIGATNWPYVQHRGGPKGFLTVLDGNTIAFADFAGNRQYLTTGNIATNNRVSLILVDYPRQARLKLLGQVEIFEGAAAQPLLGSVWRGDYEAHIERVYVIRVEAFEWNCNQHIHPRYTVEQIQDVLAPIERKIQELEAENQRLKGALSLPNSLGRVT